MARAKVIHSTNAVMIAFKGDVSSPEPETGVIKFPGGFVEVSRCSDGQYYAHICADKAEYITDSRIDYNYDGYLTNGIPDIPNANQIEKLAVKINGPYLEPGE